MSLEDKRTLVKEGIADFALCKSELGEVSRLELAKILREIADSIDPPEIKTIAA